MTSLLVNKLVERARAAVARRRQRRRLAQTVERARRFSQLLPPPDVDALSGRTRGRLERIFDANHAGPGIWKWRHYFPVYERHFARFVGRPVRVLEIGIYSGGSLGMWREYFGQGCRIIGVDIEPACEVYGRDGVEVVIGDQGDHDFWARFRAAHAPVDIIIDDGGHLPHQQIATLEMLLPHLRPGGVYLCEDVQGEHNEFHAYVDALAGTLSPFLGAGPIPPGAVHHHIESIHRYPQLVVIEKPATPVESFDAPKHGTEWQPDFEDEMLRADNGRFRSAHD